MKRKIIILFIAALLLAATLTSCTYVPKVSYDTVTRITLDAGVSVELIVNRENNVVAVTPLNDMACALLINEDLLMTSPDKAIDKIMTLILKGGFDGDKVLLSISGNSDYVDVITDMIEKKIEKRLKKFKLDATVEIIEPMEADDLRAICLDGHFYTEDEMSMLGDGELIYYLALRRKEGAFLPSLELKSFYFISKECYSEIYFVEGKLGSVETVKDEHPEDYAAYASAFEALKASALALEEAARALYLEEANIDLTPYYSDLKAKKEAITSLEEGFGKEVTYAIRSAYTKTQPELAEKKARFQQTFYDMYKSEIEEATNALTEMKNELTK